MDDTAYHSGILRLPVGEVPKTRKSLMTVEQMRDLLTGTVVLEEKLDGKLLRVHAQGMEFFYEDLHIRHSVLYDRLPGFNILLDVWDGLRFRPDLKAQHGSAAWVAARLENADPDLVLALLPAFLRHKSLFSSQATVEGVVLKNYAKGLMGKVVNSEFYRGIERDGSYLRRRPPEWNRLGSDASPPVMVGGA